MPLQRQQKHLTFSQLSSFPRAAPRPTVRHPRTASPRGPRCRDGARRHGRSSQDGPAVRLLHGRCRLRWLGPVGRTPPVPPRRDVTPPCRAVPCRAARRVGAWAPQDVTGEGDLGEVDPVRKASDTARAVALGGVGPRGRAGGKTVHADRSDHTSRPNMVKHGARTLLSRCLFIAPFGVLV